MSKNITELIAAGEVVERPASVVKELVENSIDSGADRIIVEIKNGGITYISVSDNGCGIDKEELPTAFIRHATSKISNVNDLNSIGTMGFRGEALPSIAACSHVIISSKTKSSESGWSFDTISGEIFPVGSTIGTVITVSELFYNTPVRMKFLKKDVAEGNAVETLLQRIALSNPNISFTLIREGKIKIKTMGEGSLKTAIRLVFGSELARNMLNVNYVNDGVSVKGLISTPRFTRHTRSLQTFFVNNRFVHSRTCQSALEEAYKNKIMTGNFPACVLNLTMDSSLVDVNIHPAKLEVRFQNERDVYNSVYKACLDSLINFQQPASFRKPSKINQFSLNAFDYSKDQIPLGDKTIPSVISLKDSTSLDKDGKISAVSPPRLRHIDLDIEVDEKYSPSTSINKHIVKKDFKLDEINDKTNAPIDKNQEIAETTSTIPRIDSQETDNTPVLNIRNFESSNKSYSDKTEHYNIIGEVFDTYILVEQENNFILIDKHAAHEGYIYHSIKDSYKMKNFYSQIFLTPSVISLSGEEYFLISENLKLLSDFGIKAEVFGDKTILVREIPMVLGDCNITVILSDIAANLKKGKSNITPQFLDRLLYSVSCRAATMAGKKSKMPELKLLASLVLEKGINFCPHGRPCKVSFKKREIEKMFGRSH